MEQYPSNSNASKARKTEATPKAAAKGEKKVEKVVTGNVIRRKKPLGKRFVETFAGGDTTSVRQYILMEVIVPNVRDLIHDVGMSYLDRILYPDSRAPVRRSRLGSNGSSVGKFNYGAASTSIRKDPREEQRRSLSYSARSNHSFEEIILESRAEAEDTLTRMFDQLRDYGTVTVADLYDMAGITTDFTDHKWGWDDLRGSRVRHVPRYGYLLDLPKPIAIGD